VVTPLSHERSEIEATAFLAAFKACTDGHPPLFTSDKLPAYVTALVANYSTAEPLPAQRGRGRPRKTPRRLIDPNLLYAQVDKRREQGRVVEVRRRIVFGDEAIITTVLDG
jgi:transposase-like protein